jgi:hypothetical protein
MQIKIDFFRVGVMKQFQAITDFHQKMEALIHEGHHLERSRLLIESNLNQPTDPGAIEEWFCGHQAEIAECDRRSMLVCRQILRYSFLVSLSTLIESNLSRIVKEMVKRKGLNRGMVDQKNSQNSIVDRFKDFWTNVANLPWDDDAMWKNLMDIKETRNCIAHGNGRPRKLDKRVLRLIDKNEGVRLTTQNDPGIDPDEAGLLQIEERFCQTAVNSMIQLFFSIFERAGCFGPEIAIVEN